MKTEIFSSHDNGLSVVVCSYERHQLLCNTLTCLLDQDVSSLLCYEIIVVDNSADQAKAMQVAAQYQLEPRISYLIADKPGLSHARNIGLHAARYSVIAFVDDDVIIPQGWANAIQKAFAGSMWNVAMVGGRVELAWTAPRPSWLHQRLLGYLGHLDLGVSAKPMREGQNAIGCNMAFNRRSLLEIGGFNEWLGRMGGSENLLSNEELQVGIALRKAGMQLWYAPDACLNHIVDPARLEMAWFRRRIIWQAISDVAAAGPRLKVLRLRAHFRRLLLPTVCAAVRLRGGVRSGLYFALELELLYDNKLLELGPVRSRLT